MLRFRNCFSSFQKVEIIVVFVRGRERDYTMSGSGWDMPLVGLGTYGVKAETCTASVKAALLAGYRMIDTAACYKNESAVADAIDASGIHRNTLWITTKLQPGDQTGADAVLAAVQRSLKNLRTTYLDLYLIHWPGTKGRQPSHSQHRYFRRESWKVLEELHRQGVLRHIGVSNYTARHLRGMVEDGAVLLPHVNQIELHPMCQQSETVRQCQQMGIHVMAYASLGQGRLVGHPVVAAVAAQLGCDAAVVLLAWGLQHGYAVIPRSARTERVVANYQALMDVDGKLKFALTTTQMDLLDGLREEGKDVHFCWSSEEVL